MLYRTYRPPLPPWTLILPIIPPRLAHPLAQPTIFDEILLQPSDLPIQKEITLVYQTNHNVGADDAVPRFQELAVGFKRLVLSVGQASDEQGLFAVFFPNNAPVVADVVLVIFQQLFLTGPCHRWPVRGNRGMSDGRCMVNIYLKEDKKF